MTREKPICMDIIGAANFLRRAMAEEEKNEYGLSGIQYWVIGFIYHHSKKGAIFQKDIEKIFELSRSSASEMLQKMEQQGLIVRKVMQEDKRSKEIILLPKGVKACQKASLTVKAFDGKVEKGLTEDEIRDFRKCLNKIKSNIFDIICTNPTKVYEITNKKGVESRD